MTVARTRPFISPDPRSVEASPWIKDGDQHLEDGTLLPTWDPSTQVTVVRMVQINIGLMMETGRILPGSRLAIVPTWWSPGTGLRGKGSDAVFTAEGTTKKQLDISMVLPGEQLRHSVQARTSLVLIDRPSRPSPDPLSASRSGSVLWHDEISVVLEGDAPRFPVTAVNFSENFLGNQMTCWCLEWSPRDLEAPALSCLRLWINKEHQLFYEAAVATAPAPEQLAIRSTLRFAIAEEMLSMALDHAEDLEQGTFDHGSCGKVFVDLIEQLFPDMEPSALKQLRLREPGRFSAAIQSRTQLFSDVVSKLR
ncbi:MAG: hypothetical protein JW395_2877 [Nitrospira sp.]|nr:hypothetical protein [Nitrospira sp.]